MLKMACGFMEVFDVMLGNIQFFNLKLKERIMSNTRLTRPQSVNSGLCSKENGSEDIIPIGKFEREHFEVCGNIFDNPDLLEMEV